MWADHLVTTRQLLGSLRPQGADVATLVAPVAVALGLLLATGAVLLLVIRRPARRVLAIACVAAALPVVGLVAAHSILEGMYPWDVLGVRIQPGRGHVWLMHRRAPSLTFYARRVVVTAPNEATLETDIESEPEGWLALTRNDWTHLAAAPALRKISTTVVAQRDGMVLVRFTNPAAN